MIGDTTICGLVGLAGDTSANWKDVFTDLLVVDSLRGAHSTGMAAIKRWQNEIALVKQPGGPHSLISTPDYRNAMGAAAKCLIGHNRYATLGEHTVENAHPFVFPSVIGAHNGTLDMRAIKKLHGNEKFGTDSEAIYCNINEHGLRDTVDKLQGAWALTWFNVQENSINFLRNDKRPLYYCYSYDRCTLAWASEAGMLEYVFQRNRLKMLGDEIYVVDENTHMSWEVPDSISKKFEAPRKEKMEAPPPPPPVPYRYHRGVQDWRQNGGNSDNVLPFIPAAGKNGTSQSTGRERLITFIDRSLEVKQFRPPYKDSSGKVLNKKEFNRLTADGCVFCGVNCINWGDFIKPLKSMDGHNVFLCEECFVDEEIYEVCRNLI